MNNIVLEQHFFIGLKKKSIKFVQYNYIFIMTEESNNYLSSVKNLFQEMQESQQKLNEKLEQREKKVTERETRLDEVLKAHKNPETIIKIKVGDVLFTTDIQVINSIKDTYLSTLVAEGVGKTKEENAYFLARDPISFKIILEYLTYGEILTNEVSQKLWKRVAVDSQFYGLKELEEIALKEMENSIDSSFSNNNPKILCSKFQSSACSNGSYWNWNTTVMNQLNLTLSNSNSTITLLNPGTYQVIVKVCVGNNSHGSYTSLYLNGTDISRSFHCEANNYQYNSWHLNEVIEVKNKNEYIQIYQTYNGSVYGTNLANCLTIIQLN
jgi:hypothetical protein